MKTATVASSLLAAILTASPLLHAKKGGMTPQELVRRHLQSLGTAEGKNVVTRQAQGHSRYTVIVGGAGYLNGTAMLMSQGSSLRIQFNYPDPTYVGEELVTDGQRVQTYGNPRSSLAAFLYDQSSILRDGLFGGVLSTGWVLLDRNTARVQLSYSGIKKLDNRPLHELSVIPKKGPHDVVIHLYFEPDSYRHVMTVYEMTETRPLRPMEILSTHSRLIRYRLDERFEDFRPVNGVILPFAWNIHFAIDGSTTAMLDWNVRFNNIQEDVTLPANAFTIR